MSLEELPQRVARRIDVADSGCWLWRGAISSTGYGQTWNGNRVEGVHRYVYATLRGPITEGMVIDHLCRVRHCCNPDHLEVVPQKVNVHRGLSQAARNSRATRCQYGHAFTPENTYIRRDNGARVCKACQLRRLRQWRQKQRSLL